MSASGLLKKFCEFYEIEGALAEDGGLTLLFEGDILVSAYPSHDDSFVNVICQIEPSEVGRNSDIFLKLLELQIDIWRQYGCLIGCAVGGKVLFLSCDVPVYSSVDTIELSSAMDRLVEATRTVQAECASQPQETDSSDISSSHSFPKV